MEFEEFFRREEAALIRLCYLATMDRATACEIAQETMFRAWRNWAALETTNPAGWVRTVSLNLCRSRWRRLRREVLRANPEAHPEDLEVADIDLIRQLRKLPHRQREAIVLHYWCDLKVIECAAIMRISDGSVKRHLARGRDALAHQIGLSEDKIAQGGGP